MDRAVVKELFRQIIEGVDIPAAESLLKNITPEKAAMKLDASPYSILTNLAHADFWQQVWLVVPGLKGEIASAAILGGAPLAFAQEKEEAVLASLPMTAPDPISSTI